MSASGMAAPGWPARQRRAGEGECQVFTLTGALAAKPRRRGCAIATLRQLAAGTAKRALRVALATRRSVLAAILPHPSRTPFGHRFPSSGALIKAASRKPVATRRPLRGASNLARAGTAADGTSLLMALLSPAGQNTPRLPEQGNNAALPLSTMTGISNCLKVKHSSLSNFATNCCNLFVVETRLFGFKACQGVRLCGLY